MRRRNILIGAGVLILVVLGILSPLPVPVSLANRLAFSDPAAVAYEGRGRLYACTADGDIAPMGKNVIPLPAPAACSGRTVLVYTPPDFDPSTEYPILYLLHGFAARPSFWVENLLPSIDAAISGGTLQPLLVVMPDGTISGNGLDNLDTAIDERGGCWYIDSNLVQYRSFLLEDLPEAVQSITGMENFPDRAVIAGSSMGGFAATHYALAFPQRFPAAAGFYPALDLRYAINGNRLAPYREARYTPIHTDRPLRIVNKAVGAGILGLTDAWCFYPVFDSDTFPGPAWSEDLPVWDRMRRVNPADLLRDATPDLDDSNIFLLVGSKDDFNFDDHLDVVLSLLWEAGAEVAPADNIIPGGRHAWETLEGHLPLFIEWLDGAIRQ